MDSYSDNTHTITLMDMIKALLKNALWIVLALIVGVLMGAGYGFVKSRNRDAFGTTVRFYINAKMADQSEHQLYGAYSSSYMNDMISLLNSDYFSEFLLLDNNGLPAKGISDAVDAKITEAEAVLADSNATKAQKQKAVNAAVEEWQKDMSYYYLVSRVSSSVTFEQRGGKGEDGVASSLISVNISVYNDQKFANLLLERIKVKVPIYVEANMYVPTDVDSAGNRIYIGTSCQRVSRIDNIQLQNPGIVKSSVLKYGVVCGALTTFVACIVVLFIYASKDYKNQTLAAKVEKDVQDNQPQENDTND